MNQRANPQEKSEEMTEPTLVSAMDRRTFLLGTAATGLLGATSITSARKQGADGSQQSIPADVAGLPPDVQADIKRIAQAPADLRKPPGLRPLAQLDSRFPVYYEESVAEATRLVTKYFAAFSRGDLAKLADTIHFPYATYEGIEPLVYNSAEEFVADPPPSLHVTTKDDDRVRCGVYELAVRPGTYDILDNLRLWTYNPVNVGVELCYTRYRADGQMIGVNQGIYAITNNDRKWGLQLSSTIFTPAGFAHLSYKDALWAHLREGRTWMMAWSYHDEAMLEDSSARSRTEFRTASIAAPPGTDQWLRAARAGNPMEPYNTKGVKGRLYVSQPSRQNRETANARGNRGSDPLTSGYFYELAGGGVGRYAYTLNLPDACVLHATADKAHVLGGYIRFTEDSRPITETRSLGVIIYDGRVGRWENSTGFGQCMRRDCTNDANS
jgi:hypothetical protein